MWIGRRWREVRERARRLRRAGCDIVLVTTLRIELNLLFIIIYYLQKVRVFLFSLLIFVSDLQCTQQFDARSGRHLAARAGVPRRD